jgi:hypothetical protein
MRSLLGAGKLLRAALNSQREDDLGPNDNPEDFAVSGIHSAQRERAHFGGVNRRNRVEFRDQAPLA